MRFIRVFLDRRTGAPTHVQESELPLGSIINDQDGPLPYVDLGLMADFDAVDLGGQPCSPSRAIRLRLEKHPHADSHPYAPKVRIAPEHSDLPSISFSPCCMGAIADHLRANGADRLPTTTRAWLAMMTPPQVAARLGLDVSVPLSVAKALENNRRGTIDGGRVDWLVRETQRQSDARSARHLALRHSRLAQAADSAWAELKAAAETLEPDHA